MWVPRFFIAMTLYVAVVALLVFNKPALMFNSDGTPKEFGLGLDSGLSVFAPSFMFPLMALLIYIAVVWIKLISKA